MHKNLNFPDSESNSPKQGNLKIDQILGGNDPTPS
jgi:hypothetical protein